MDDTDTHFAGLRALATLALAVALLATGCARCSVLGLKERPEPVWVSNPEAVYALGYAVTVSTRARAGDDPNHVLSQLRVQAEKRLAQRLVAGVKTSSVEAMKPCPSDQPGERDRLCTTLVEETERSSQVAIVNLKHEDYWENNHCVVFARYTISNPDLEKGGYVKPSTAP